MRIISGDKRGMRLKTLPGEDTRPTLERVKEAVFSSIQFLVPGARVLDLFAGSGQMGLEALSRGAAHCVFIDGSRDAVDTVIENARATGLFDKCRVACMDAKAYLISAKDTFDIVYLDPPYNNGDLPDILELLYPLLAPGALVLCETGSGAEVPEKLKALSLEKQRRYGQVYISRYRAQPVPAAK